MTLRPAWAEFPERNRDRISGTRNRCTYEGGSDDELTLFVVDKTAIRPVLDLIMSHWTYRGGGNRCDREEVPRTEATVSISVEPTASNGFADLKLTARRSDKKKPLNMRVHYNGNRYDLKAWNDAFSGWWY